jgi:hypothetical protein
MGVVELEIRNESKDRDMKQYDVMVVLWLLYELLDLGYHLLIQGLI